jgi:ABC-type multidrug transport system fused ATPase/permease subunit
LRYPGQENLALKNISLVIDEGTSVALVGASGAGKTSLADIILGVIEPDSGEIKISDLAPSIVVTKWPGAIGYVPQDVIIVNGSIRQNVALGFPSESITNDLVMDAINTAQLQEFVDASESGLETQVGERGTKISGGQRQRIGVARALYTKPKLLVLDEATSALDGETEANISNAIQALRGETTILVIAHRLSTIRNFDQIIYMEDGKIVSKGTFNELRISVPDFDKQAKLMGL